MGPWGYSGVGERTVGGLPEGYNGRIRGIWKST